MQEQDVDLQPVLQWLEPGQRLPWDEVAGSSTKTKGCGQSWTVGQVAGGGSQSTEGRSAQNLSRLHQGILESPSSPLPRVLLGMPKKEI